MRVTFIVEGPSDNIILNGQLPWFASLGLDIDIITAGNKCNMARKATKFYNASIISGADHVVFLPDQDRDACALVTRNKIGVDQLPRATTIVVKRELEAWILADFHCINCTVAPNYHTVGITDDIIDPKEKLSSIIHKKLGYIPTSVEAANIFSNHFCLEKAASANNSASRLLRLTNSLL